MLRFYSLLLLLHLYIGWRILPDLPLGILSMAAVFIWLIASFILMPLGLPIRRMKRQQLSDKLAWAGVIAMGSFSSLLVLTFVRDILLLGAYGMERFFSQPLSPQLQRFSAGVVPLLATLVTLIGFINARSRAKVRVVDVSLPDLPAALDGFTIAQISDIHVGPTIKRDYLEAIVDAVNDLQVDVVAITGDLVDGSVEQLSHHTEPFARLSARYGVYVVTGNHEYYSGANAWITELRRLGLKVLMNEHVVFNITKRRLSSLVSQIIAPITLNQLIAVIPLRQLLVLQQTQD